MLEEKIITKEAYFLENEIIERLPFKVGLYTYNEKTKEIIFNRYNSNLDINLFKELKENEIILEIYNNKIYKINQINYQEA